MNKPLLDIIVTHYNETWDECKGFFNMLAAQRNVDFRQITVTLVQDVRVSDVLWHGLEKKIQNYPFRVNFITQTTDADHPRNDGFNAGGADWVMFCDIDDMFADVYSLQMILSQFPVNDYDIIWTKYISEERWSGKDVYPNRVDESNLSTVTGKLYRRAFLEEKKIRFVSAFSMYVDYIFNAIAIAETQPFRIVSLTTDFYVYCKTYREYGYSHRIENVRDLIEQRFERDIYIAQELKRRGLKHPMQQAMMRALMFDYYQIYNPANEPVPEYNTNWARYFVNTYPDALALLSVPAEVEVVRDMVETETMNLIQHIYNDHRIEFYIANDTHRISFETWLHDVMFHAPEDPEHPADALSAQAEQGAPLAPPHVAVYCGTRNTYQNMVVSSKSLLYHTPMDKVYFLIEDDVFPYELPDVIQCINVSRQNFFPPDGPNYSNVWTYMCLMRAAFTKLIPYDTVLSLDIDTIVQEDISALWDVDLSGHYLAGVPEPGRQKSPADPVYINFGVVLMNLHKLRTDGVDDDIIRALNTTRFGCPEQDAFNKLCAGHILPLPNDYNATVHSHITGDAQVERIIHYAGIRFWRHYGSAREYADREWTDIMNRQERMKAGGTNEG